MCAPTLVVPRPALAFLLVTFPLVASGGCGGDGSLSEPREDGLVRIRILVEGQGAFHALRDTLKASLFGFDGDDRLQPIQPTRAEWASLEPDVAVVAEKSLILSRSVGGARIVATYAGLSDTAAVTVVQVPTSVEINFERDTLLMGDSLKLDHVVRDSNRVAMQDAVVRWSSTAPTVAAVDSTGLVRGVGPWLARVEAAHAGFVDQGRVEVLNRFVGISAGGEHTCGLLEGGEAYCWGAALRGQTGVGGFWYQFNRPEPVEGGFRFTQLSAGDAHTCALADGGIAYCWGWNEWGQLGTGDQADRDVPTAVPTDLRFAQIRAGGRMTCGVTVDGGVVCWGRVQVEELPARPADGFQEILEDLVFTTVGVADLQGCALTTGGDIYCWGDDYVPRMVSGGLVFQSLSVGGLLCGLLTTGDARCLGDLDDNGQVEWHAVGGDPGMTFFDGSAEHVCALADAAAYCWGNNYRGQLGNGTRNTVAWDWLGPPESVQGGFPFEKLSAGGNHTCGIWEGQPLCWGSNSSGQLGNTAPPETCTDNPLDPCTARPIRVTRARVLW